MSGLTNPAQWLVDWFSDKFGTPDSPRVTAESMLRLPAVWYAINKISGHIAQMPIDIKRRLPQGAEDAYGHKWWTPLRGRINAYQTADIFKEQIQGHAMAWGNGRGAIVRIAMPELLPMQPDRTICVLHEGIKYHVSKPTAEQRIWNFPELILEMRDTPNDVVVLRDADVLHIQGFGYDGINGKSAFEVGRDPLGIALQCQAYQNRQLKKGFAGQVMLTAPMGVFTKEEDAKRFLADFRKTHDLAQDGEAIGLLRQGITANVMAASPKDAQLVERMVFDRQEVMLLFGLESMPGDNNPRGGYNGLEQMNLAYLINCLNRWLVKWEMQMNAKLRSESEIRLDRVFFKFNTATLLRMDTQATAATLGNLVVHKILNANEARDKLDLPAREGGDVYENPAIAVANNQQQPQEASEPEPDNTATKAQQKHFIGIESNRIVALSKSKTFAKRCEEFYAGWREKLLDAQNLLGVVPEQIEEHIDTSRQLLLSCIETGNFESVKEWPTSRTIGGSDVTSE